MLYLWVKAFHVVAVITWIGGMLVVASVLAVLPSLELQGSDRQRAAQVVRAWDRAVTTPAMLLVWALPLAPCGFDFNRRPGSSHGAVTGTHLLSGLVDAGRPRAGGA